MRSTICLSTFLELSRAEIVFMYEPSWAVLSEPMTKAGAFCAGEEVAAPFVMVKDGNVSIATGAILAAL